MFQKNDRFLFAARIVFIVLTVIGVLVSIILPIYLAVETENAFYVFYIILYLALCLIFFVFWNLLLTFLVDVKLIRNKLYIQDNAPLVKFTGNLNDPKEKQEEQPKHEDQADADNWKGIGYADGEDIYGD